MTTCIIRAMLTIPRDEAVDSLLDLCTLMVREQSTDVAIGYMLASLGQLFKASLA